jgi:hypothetical protein
MNSTNDGMKPSRELSHVNVKFASTVLKTVTKMMDTNSPMNWQISQDFTACSCPERFVTYSNDNIKILAEEDLHHRLSQRKLCFHEAYSKLKE